MVRRVGTPVHLATEFPLSGPTTTQERRSRPDSFPALLVLARWLSFALCPSATAAEVRAVEIRILTRTVNHFALATKHQPRPVFDYGSWAWAAVGFSSRPEPPPLADEDGTRGHFRLRWGFQHHVAFGPCGEGCIKPDSAVLLVSAASLDRGLRSGSEGTLTTKQKVPAPIHPTFKHHATGGIVVWPRGRDGPLLFISRSLCSSYPKTYQGRH
jgi:hypothetical protein